MAKKFVLETISATRKTEIVRQITQRSTTPAAGRNNSRPASAYTHSTSASMSSSDVNNLLSRVFASVTSSTR